MPRGIDTFLAELGLEHAEPTGYQRGDDPASQIQRAGLNHAVLSRMLGAVEALAPFLKLDKAVVFGRGRSPEANVPPGKGDLVTSQFYGVKWWRRRESNPVASSVSPRKTRSLVTDSLSSGCRQLGLRRQRIWSIEITFPTCDLHASMLRACRWSRSATSPTSCTARSSARPGAGAHAPSPGAR
jgi:hypothetical protein